MKAKVAPALEADRQEASRVQEAISGEDMALAVAQLRAEKAEIRALAAFPFQLIREPEAEAPLIDALHKGLSGEGVPVIFRAAMHQGTEDCLEACKLALLKKELHAPKLCLSHFVSPLKAKSIPFLLVLAYEGPTEELRISALQHLQQFPAKDAALLLVRKCLGAPDSARIRGRMADTVSVLLSQLAEEDRAEAAPVFTEFLKESGVHGRARLLRNIQHRLVPEIEPVILSDLRSVATDREFLGDFLAREWGMSERKRRKLQSRLRRIENTGEELVRWNGPNRLYVRTIMPLARYFLSYPTAARREWGDLLASTQGREQEWLAIAFANSGNIKASVRREALKRVVLGSKSAWLRAEAAQLLMKQEFREAMPVLIGALEDSCVADCYPTRALSRPRYRYPVRDAAAKSLRGFGVALEAKQVDLRGGTATIYSMAETAHRAPVGGD